MGEWMGNKESIVHIVHIVMGTKQFFIHMLYRFFFCTY